MASPTAPVSVHDVAAYILAQCGNISTMKLHKLVYYCQAWSLVWDERPLFAERIEAWASGPVVPALFKHHKGTYAVSTWSLGDPRNLDSDARDTVDAVIRAYGKKKAQWLVDLTHKERPWREARAGVPDGDPSNNTVSLDAMLEYYSGLHANG
jgi:uncharacterized phage-associated protein